MPLLTAKDDTRKAGYRSRQVKLRRTLEESNYPGLDEFLCDNKLHTRPTVVIKRDMTEVHQWMALVLFSNMDLHIVTTVSLIVVWYSGILS